MTLTISRKRAVAIGACLTVAAALLFFAGSLSGILYSASQFSVFEEAHLTSAGQRGNAASTPKQMVAASATHPAAAAGPAPNSAAAPGAAAAAPAASVTPQPAQTAAIATGSTAPAVLAVANSASTSAGMPPQTVAADSGASSAPAAASETQESQPAQATSGSTAGANGSAAFASASYAIPLAVQVGSFTAKSNADALVQSLKNLGYSPLTSFFTDAQGKVWYVVKLGPYTRWSEATRAATRVSIAENVTPMIGPMD